MFKNVIALAVCAISICAVQLNAQQYSVSLSTGLHSPVFSRFSGSANEVNRTVHTAYFHELMVGYSGKRGFLAGLSIGYQKEHHHFAERAEADAPLGMSFHKWYRSFPVCATVGWLHPLGDKSKYFLFTNGSVGVANVSSNDVDENYDGSGIYFVVPPMAVDTIVQVREVNDDARDRVMIQARGAVGAEYRADHFFIRSYLEYRAWMDYFGTISYHSEYSSTLNDSHRDRSGNYKLRTGYLGIVFSAGFYFPKR